MAQKIHTPEEMADFRKRWEAGESPAAIMRESDSASLAALGIPTAIGDLRILFNPESIARLGAIGSPFLADGDGDQTLTDQDIANAVYAMAGGNDAIAPLLGMRQRRKQLDTRKAEALAAGRDQYGAWLDKDMQLAAIWNEFEFAATQYYSEHCAGMDIQDVTDALVAGFNDAFSWADTLVDGDQKKTTEPPRTTPNGSDRQPDRWWSWASRWIARCRSRSHCRAG